jgi:radical SAM superfamily enzyme YgiQ (UPF0313 family)
VGEDLFGLRSGFAAADPTVHKPVEQAKTVASQLGSNPRRADSQSMKIMLIYLESLKVMPMGLMYIGTVLKENGNDVKIIGLPGTSKESGQDIQRELATYMPEVVGISVCTYEVVKSIGVAKAVKEYDSGIKVIAGGPHPSILPTDLLLRSNDIDICVIGEGELTVVGLVNAIEKGADLGKVKGISFRNAEGDPVVTARREFIANLDDLPFIDRGLLPIDILTRRGGYPVGYPNMYVVTSRGCPFQCTFCKPTEDIVFGNKIRRRSVQNVINEVRLLKERYDIGGLWINDDTLFTSKAWLNEFCDQMIREHLQITWAANGRLSPVVTEETLSKMRLAGCVYLVMTFETGSERVRNQILNKAVSNEDVCKYLGIVKRSKIPFQSNIMIGSPTETIDELFESVTMIDAIKPSYMNMSFTTLMPGTYLYEEYKDQEGYEYLRDDEYIHSGWWARSDGCSKIPKEFKELVYFYFLHKYTNRAPYARFRNFVENSYARSMFFFRLRTLILKKNKNMKHFLYDIYLLGVGMILYSIEKMLGDRKLDRIRRARAELAMDMGG